MVRKVAAIVVGVLFAVALVFAVQMTGHNIFPVADSAMADDPEQLAAFIATLPIGALIFVPLSWFVGAFIGGAVAVAIAREQSLLIASVVSGFILVAAVSTLVAIPHPAWLVILGVGGIVASAILAAKVGTIFSGWRNSGAPGND